MVNGGQVTLRGLLPCLRVRLAGSSGKEYRLGYGEEPKSIPLWGHYTTDITLYPDVPLIGEEWLSKNDIVYAFLVMGTPHTVAVLLLCAAEKTSDGEPLVTSHRIMYRRVGTTVLGPLGTDYLAK